MRYRRYYTQRNRDGSRTVISVGPLVGPYIWLFKITGWVLGIALVFMLPWLPHYYVPGAWGWFWSSLSALIWYSALMAGMVETYKKPKGAR